MSGILKSIWGKQDGYVFVPALKDGKWREGRAYKYPEEIDVVLDYVKAMMDTGWNTYWCPLVFNVPKRLKENALPNAQILWSDLDYVNPDDLDELKPTIAWASSDERYQALWVLNKRAPVEQVEALNRALTYAIGADRSGWDVTQVLRIPGSPNHKYSPPQQGRILWADKTRLFDSEKLKDILKADEAIAETVALQQLQTPMELLAKFHIPKRTTALLTVEESEIEVGERSDRLWEIETSLVESGVPINIIIQVIQGCPWNKFKGRRDEVNQIFQECLKAEEHVKTRVATTLQEVDPEIEAIKESSWAIPYSKFVGMTIDKPEWLVEGIWQKGTYGMIAGEPKTYKSVQATDLALSVASGRPYLNHFKVITRGAVIYVQEENNQQTVQDRVNKIAVAKGLLRPSTNGMALPDDIPIYFSNNFGVDLTKKESRERLEKSIKEINPVLLILDPLYMMFGDADENSSKEVGDVLRWLTYIRNSYGCAIVVCHHYNKGGNNNSRGGQRVRGSSAFHAWVESALYVKTTSEDFTVDVEREFRAFPTIGDFRVRIEMGMPGHLMYNAEVETDPASSGKATGGKAKANKELKEEDMLAFIIASPRTEHEIARATKMKGKPLTDMLANLVAKGSIEIIDGGVKNRGAKMYAHNTSRTPSFMTEGSDVI